MVPVHRAAWHVGSGELTAPGQGTITRSINRSTIGIELGNCGPLYQKDTGWCWDDNGTMRPYRGLMPPVRAGLAYPSGLHVEEWWEPYPDPQIEALTDLLVRIASMGYEVAVRNLVGHDEVSRPYGHKTDPGPLFPWTRYHRDVPRPLESTIVPG
jgi:N-acetyl-anhydromuramyl-L-alanine amidase AmpD